MKLRFGKGSVTTDTPINAFKIRYSGAAEITPAENMHIASNEKTIVGVMMNGEATTELFEYDGNLKIKRCEVAQNNELVYPVISDQATQLPERINSDPQYIDQKPEDMTSSYGEPKKKTTIKTGKDYGI